MDKAKIRGALRGSPVSLEVVEADGARTGFRTQPAPCDGFLVERGDVSIYLDEETVRAAVAMYSRLRKQANRRDNGK